MRTSPSNPYRWVLDNGQPFVPLGTNWGASAVDGGDDNSAFGSFPSAMFSPIYALSVMRNSGINMMRFKCLIWT